MNAITKQRIRLNSMSANVVLYCADEVVKVRTNVLCERYGVSKSNTHARLRYACIAVKETAHLCLIHVALLVTCNLDVVSITEALTLEMLLGNFFSHFQNIRRISYLWL